MVSQLLSSVFGSAQRGSSPVRNRQAPSSRVAAARSVGGSGRPPLAKSAITMANAISVAMTMPMISLRCVASIEAAVEEIDLGITRVPWQFCPAWRGCDQQGAPAAGDFGVRGKLKTMVGAWGFEPQ